MMAALVREMMHDILLTKSEFTVSIAWMLGQHLGYEKEAYFNTFYLSGGIAALNNVRWWSGVSVLGLSIYNKNEIFFGELHGERMYGKCAGIRNSDRTFVIWTPDRQSHVADSEVTRAFIERNDCLLAAVLENVQYLVGKQHLSVQCS